MNETTIERFQKFYHALNGDEQNALYYMMAAVRGPDTQGEVAECIKDDTTMRVRTMLFGANWYTPEETPKYTYAEVLEAVGSHFAGHLLDAREHLKRIGIDLELFKPKPE